MLAAPSCSARSTAVWTVPEVQRDINLRGTFHGIDGAVKLLERYLYGETPYANPLEDITVRTGRTSWRHREGRFLSHSRSASAPTAES